MMRSTFFSLFLIGTLCISLSPLNAQTGLVLQVDSATINLTCGDFFGIPEPMWGVAINGEAYQYYPQVGPCFTALPNQQFTANVSCPADLPTEIEVCFHGLENDPFLPAPISCEINPDCEATICQNFTVPAPGLQQALSLELPAGGDVTGTLYFSLGVESFTPPVTNDFICDAIDLGTLEFNNFLGNLVSPVYSNYCASNTNEPNPFDIVAPGVFLNDQGVWFSFTTDTVASKILLIDVRSDPLQTGDEFDGQVALYEFPGGDCTASPTLIASNSDNSGFDVQLRPTCIKPNTKYYILIDGGTFGNESIEGPFSFRIIDPGVQEGGDLRCDFEDLGVVPENGIIETDGFRSNICATDIQDPFVAAFVSQHSVWYSFIAPSSGHVRIDALSDQLIQPLDAQLAVYDLFGNGTCTSFFRHLKSQYIPGDPDESMEVSCLFGGRRYFVLVDGSGYQPRGIFKISVSDLGDITPVVQVDTMVCAGETVRVGFKTYDMTGNYIDTLTIQGGCDSIVYTNLTVGEPLQIDFQQTRFAFGEGMADAEAQVTVSGGIGTPNITWCDGQTGPKATGLIGGSLCCVTVVDSIGCSYEACFEVEYITGVAPIYQDTSVACFGDENGVISLSAANGLPPYSYDWNSANGALSGSGVIDSNFQLIQIPDLPAGTYTFSIRDSYRDSTFTININEPPRLDVRLLDQQEITCAGSCNGSLAIEISGGTPPYQLNWNDGDTSDQRDALCAGTYAVTVTDINGCQTELSTEFEDPLPFTATAELLQEVSCFQGANGQIGVRIENGKAADYQWSNGATTPSQSNLSAGFYQLTVTSDLFCESITEIEVTEPNGPLVLDIQQLAPISCGGEADGALQAQVEGPFQNLNYQWSNGATDAAINNLGVGQYFLQIRNERDCITSDSFSLEEPPLIAANLSTRDITCLDPPESGIIFVDDVSGGLGDYRFSIDGDRFTSTPLINNLPGGDYALIVQDRGGCEQQFPITIQTPPELTVSLGQETIELDLGDSIEISALASSSTVSYRWDHDDALVGPSATVTPQVSSYYRVQAEDTQTLCQAEAIVFVQVNKNRRVYIPNAFSPNMDGNNDYFFIYGDNDIVVIESLQVFTREGQLVYQNKDLSPNDPIRSWDGTLNGQELSSGVYVYFAEIRFVDGLTEIFKGDVALIR